MVINYFSLIATDVLVGNIFIWDVLKTPVTSLAASAHAHKPSLKIHSVFSRTHSLSVDATDVVNDAGASHHPIPAYILRAPLNFQSRFFCVMPSDRHHGNMENLLETKRTRSSMPIAILIEIHISAIIFNWNLRERMLFACTQYR